MRLCRNILKFAEHYFCLTKVLISGGGGGEDATKNRGLDGLPRIFFLL